MQAWGIVLTSGRSSRLYVEFGNSQDEAVAKALGELAVQLRKEGNKEQVSDYRLSMWANKNMAPGSTSSSTGSQFDQEIGKRR